jgi:hypothetical protein
MTISTYSVDSALQAYSKQNKMRIKTNSSPEGTGQRSSIDSVSISAEADSVAKSNKEKPFYSIQEIISRKLIPLPETLNNNENETQDLPDTTDSIS